MPNSYVIYEADGSTPTFSVPFPYINQDHVTVKVNTVEATFTWPTSATVTISPTPADGDAIEVRRTTPAAPLVDYTDGSVLTEADLDLGYLQNLYISQEASDRAGDSLAKDSTGNYDVGDKLIKNVADPVSSGDATNKSYVDAKVAADITTINSAKSAALAAQVAAETAETNAETAQTASEAAQSAAETAETNSETAQAAAEGAQASAEAAEDGAVIAQAAAVAAQGLAETAQTAAETAETGAETAETGAVAAKVSLETARDAAIAAQTGSETAQAASEAAQAAAETAQAGAVTAKTNSETAQAAAETAETGSETAQTASEAARDKAQLWAEETTDVEVETGAYSAKHWAAKAQISAGGAIVSGAAGALQFSDGADQLASNAAELYWDAANKRLGIGKNTPEYPLDVQANDYNLARFRHLTDSGNGYIKVGSKLTIGTWGGVVRLGTQTTGNIAMWTGAGFQGFWSAYSNGGLRVNDSGAISSTAAGDDSILEVTGTSGGVLFPRLTTAQRTAISSPRAGLVVYDTDIGSLMSYNGSEWFEMSVNSSAPDVVVEDQKASGTGGGAINTGYHNTWKKRVLNTEVRDVLSVTLSGDAVTLPAGTYYAEASSPGFGANHFRCRIYDETNSVELGLGDTGYSGTNAQDWTHAAATFTLSAPAAISVQYQANFNGSSTSNLGQPYSGAGISEVYTRLKIWKTK